jgi:tRNA-Thr(GGU) m(6)t(6)A37 methyltransferase TsaA
MSDEFRMRPIGRVESCFDEKFGTPRQSGVVPEARGRVVFSGEVPPEATRGLEEFSHLWLIVVFDQVPEIATRWMVRPPRLGGNEKKGVFATRSPFRPNRLGLSLVSLEAVKEDCLEIAGLDLVNGTPVLDLKPYLPYAEAMPEAKGGFADRAPGSLPVEFSPVARDSLEAGDRRLVAAILAADPRPAYHRDGRTYGCRISGREVTWRVEDGRVMVLSSRPAAG